MVESREVSKIAIFPKAVFVRKAEDNHVKITLNQQVQRQNSGKNKMHIRS